MRQNKVYTKAEQREANELLQEGMLSGESFDWIDGGATPTVCPEGCEVEPDGYCPHGYESVLVMAGLI